MQTHIISKMPIIHIGEKNDLFKEQCSENWISS